LQLLFPLNGLTLKPFPYFKYLPHTDVSGLIGFDDLDKIWPFPVITAQNEQMRAMTHLPVAVMAPNNLLDASSSAPVHIDLTTGVCQPPTAHQRAVITHVMAKIWGILSPREFQVEAVARLVFEPHTCPFLIRKTGEGKFDVVLTASTLLRGIMLMVMPLLGLGCDQVSKAQHHHYQVEAFHLDKNRSKEDQLAIQLTSFGVQ
jgi:superfamily II DNA helicase RecQ